MDFAYSEEQQSVRDLARGILEQEATQERLRVSEKTEDWIDAALWQRLAAAN